MNTRKPEARDPKASTLSAKATESVTVQCDWFQKTNAANHRTDEYNNDALILRRGETFKVAMTFKGIKFSEIMKTVLGFSIATSDKDMRKIETRCRIVDKIDQSKWCMEVVEKNASGLHVAFKVNIPPNAIVGRYSFDVIVPTSPHPILTSNVIILFNPWCKDDEVYLDNEDERKEYVLSDTGTIYKGKFNYFMPKKWNYGQFEKNVLDCVLLLLEKDKRSQRNPLKALYKRSSSLWVARILSAMVNSSDDNGVLMGNWSGDYEGGRTPFSWNGSVGILLRYFRTESPVRYGQCWVFGGVMTTTMRALGIPARTVTNFNSAHDTDQSMTIDDFYDEDGNKLNYLNADSVWNFHVWNEIWSKRRDLPGNKYDGWQVVDATPQEASMGLYQLGPAPVKAVKEGEIYAGFDTGFVFAEVNADIVKWIVTKDDNGNVVFQKPERKNTRHVGVHISTKKVGSEGREDITHLYKYEEGTDKERNAFKTAFNFGAGAANWAGHFHVEKEGKDLTLDLKSDPSDTIPNGKNFTAATVVTNTSQQTVTVNVRSVLNSIVYTGETKHLIKSQNFDNVSIGAGKSVKLEMPVTVQEYIHKLTEMNTLRMVSVAKVLETSKVFVEDFDLQLDNKDRITVKFPVTKLKVGSKSEVTVSFNNNLPIPLTNLVFTIEGAGLSPPIQERSDVVDSGKTVTKTFSITPYKSGARTLIVDIDSKEIKDFKSYENVDVLP